MSIAVERRIQDLEQRLAEMERWRAELEASMRDVSAMNMRAAQGVKGKASG